MDTTHTIQLCFLVDLSPALSAGTWAQQRYLCPNATAARHLDPSQWPPMRCRFSWFTSGNTRSAQAHCDARVTVFRNACERVFRADLHTWLPMCI